MSRDATLYIDDMIEACRRVMQYTEALVRAQLVSGTMPHDASFGISRCSAKLRRTSGGDAPDGRHDRVAPHRRVARRPGTRLLRHRRDIVWSIVAEEVPALLPRLISLRSRL